jgi:hypothetical protein
MLEKREIDPLTPDDARILWMHVLRKAVEDFKHGRTARREESRLAYRDAERWIWSDGEEFPSFVSICEILDLSPDRVRRALRGYRLQQHGSESSS